MMQSAIGYLRVSTRERGRSGLGLAAQRREIESFGAREGFLVKSWHQDIQTGAKKDALLLRAGLAAALKAARVGSTLPSDHLEARPPVTQRALHHRTHGAQGAFRRCSSR
jgi:DNA invertase Pin-like site-specific DNA recombinase